MKPLHFTPLALTLGVSLSMVSGCGRNPGTGPDEPLASFPPQTAVEMVAPSNNVQGVSLNTLFWWNEVEGALYYHLQVARDAAFTDLIYDEPGITGHLLGYSGLSLNYSYYWRVRARNQYGAGPWSEAWTFTTWDGSSSMPLEGTWRLMNGHFETAGYYYVDWIEIDVWGDAMVVFYEGTWQIEGRRWIQRSLNYQEDSTYIDYLDTTGVYSVEGSSVTVDNLMGDVFYHQQKAEFSIVQDELTLIFEPSYYFYSWGYPVAGYLNFRRN